MASDLDLGSDETRDGEDDRRARLLLLSMSEDTVAATLAGDGEWDDDGDDEDEDVPERIDRYLVLERLGAGAMGQVYSAYDPDLDRKLALKLLLREDSATNHRTIRLLREAQALARVSHQNVIQVYDVGTFDDRVYIAMEFIDGQTLSAWLAAAPRPLRALLEVFIQAGRGLEAAHQKGLVHRDFKPDNVLVARDGRVVVLDFGIAHAVRRAEHHDDDSLTRSRARDSSSTTGTTDGLMASVVREASGIEPVHGTSRGTSQGTSRGTSQGPTPTPRAGGEDSALRRLEASSAFDAELTHAGALIGTPAYMSPEQIEGRGADERSDQFSFCVALWEAIHGERPFAGKSPLSLWQAMRAGKLRPPARSRAPKAIQRALTRGLALDPRERFPDVGALLTVLERDPAVIRKRLAGAAAALAALTFGVWGLVNEPDPAAACVGASEQLASIWGPPRRLALDHAFASSGLPLATSTLPVVIAGLDRYAQDWAQMRTEACEATHVRAEQSAELLDRRMACLDTRKLALDALVEVLLDPDATVIENSYAAVSALPPIASCAKLSTLAARVPPPEDPAVADTVAAIERELSRARARRDAGDHARALTLARAGLDQASATHYAPIEAAARIEVGRALIEAGEYEEAAAALREGFYRALTADDDDAALTAATALVQVSGDRQQHFDDAHNWASIAEALLARRSDPRSRAHVELQYLRGVVLWREGELDASRAQLEAALELATALGPSERLLEIRVRKGLGSTLWSQGEAAAAAAQFEAVVAALRAELGPNHPQVGSALNNLASAHYTLGERELAEAEFVQTLAIYEQSYGDEHPSVANSLNNLAVVYTRAGKLEQARATHLRVIALHERTLGPEHVELANSWSNLGRVLRRLHEYEDAADYYERAYERRREVLGPEHTDTMTSLGGLGLALIELGGEPGEGGEGGEPGNVEAGIAKLETVVETQTRVLGPDHPSVTEVQREFGEALVDIGRVARGEDLIRVSLATRERTLAPDHLDVAESLAALVHALVARDAAAEAIEVAARFYAIEDTAKPPPLVRARARLDHARAALELGDAADAARQVRTARKLIGGVEGPDARQLRRALDELDR